MIIEDKRNEAAEVACQHVTFGTIIESEDKIYQVLNRSVLARDEG